MKTEEISNQPLVLRRIRFFCRGGIGGTVGIVSAYRASWVFRQKPVPSHRHPESWSFEVETLRHPKEGQLALKATGTPLFDFEVLWERPGRPDEGEGPDNGCHSPAGNDRPAGPY
jgi:hypothetical protein